MSYTNYFLNLPQVVRIRLTSYSHPVLTLKVTRCVLFNAFCVFLRMSLTAHSFLSSLSVSRRLCFLSSLHSRCSSCFCSVDKESSGFRSGTCLCLIRRKRRSPESWCRRSWLESPKCAAFWSGETSRLYIRGG